MSHPTTGVLRWMRSAVVTSVVVGLAATAHVAGGGRLPSPLVFSALLVTVTCAAFLCTRRRLGFSAVTALLGTGQVLLHEAFTTSSTAGPAVGPVGHAHTPAQVAVQLSVLPGSTTSSALGPEPMHGSALMVLAHVAATALAAVVVARGEHALWTLLAWLSPLARVARTAVPVQVRPVRHHREDVVQRPRVLLLARQVPRRGPPVRFARA